MLVLQEQSPDLQQLQEIYPLADDHPYHPKKADLDDLLKFERGIGVDHVCIVAMSVYGKISALEVLSDQDILTSY